MPYATNRKSTLETDTQVRAVRRPPVLRAQVGDSPADSPARTVQERLAEDYRLVTDPDDGRRWSPRATLAFSGGMSLALWAAIALALSLIR